MHMPTSTYTYIQIHAFTFAQLRNREALLLSCYDEFHYFISLAAFHSERIVAEEQWFWKVWLGKKDCSGGKDYVQCDQSLEFDTLLFHRPVDFT